MVMSAPLPRIYEDTGNGRVTAQLPSDRECDNLIGGDFNVEDLQRVSRDTVIPPKEAATACGQLDVAVTAAHEL